MLRVVGEDGSPLLSKSELGLTDSQLVHLYRSMLTARILDDWILRLQRAGKVFFHTPNIGHEAVGGIAYALEDRDWIFPTHRDLALHIARGVKVSEILSHFFCNIKSPYKGRDILQQASPEHRIMQIPIPMGTNIPPSVGFAIACKYRRTGEVVVTLFGDGASSKGDFHEGLNFAGVFKAPIVFICENNQYAISVPIDKQTASENIAVKAVAYGFEGVRVDGNDPIAIYQATREAVQRARRGAGPTLIELYMYRLGAHSTADDPKTYRGDEEVARWMEKEPVRRFETYLKNLGILTDKEAQEIREEIEEEIRKAIEENENLPRYSPREVILDDVYKEKPWFLEELVEELKE